MKRPVSFTSALAAATMLTTAAMADNAAVENAIKSRSDLSTFYQALTNTGVNHELQPGTTYTVFAPTNEAMARITQQQYPCFYTTECRAQVAQIVRDHIVPDKIYADDAMHQRGGVYTLGGRFVAMGETSRNDLSIAGNNVFYMSDFGSGILYKINGVIIEHRDLAMLEAADYTDSYPPAHITTTTTQRVVNDPACGPGGCPDTVTTTVTRSINETPALLEPAR